LHEAAELTTKTMTRCSIAAVLLVCSLLALQCYAVDTQHKSSSRLHQRSSSSAAALIAAPGIPKTSLSAFQSTGVMDGDDFLSQVRTALSHELANLTKSNSAVDPSLANFVELSQQVSARTHAQTGAQVKLQPFCEMCILVMQMKERGQPHLCAGLNDNNYITCVEVLISLLRADKALVYWLKSGCMHVSATGPEIIQPCPALNICSWVPNLFSQPTSVVQDGVESLCPRDSHFLPTIPQEYKDLLTQQQQT